MEFWLKQSTETLRLPVLPKEFSISRSGNNETFKVENLGEISFIGKPNLATVSFESFFPNRQYSFCQYINFPKPVECIALIEKWMNSGKPIRFTITGTNLNMEFTIENFEYKQQDGTGDVFFSLELKEYRRIVLETITSNTAVKTTQRNVTKITPQTYTVKSGDTLYKIAKKLYGDGNKWVDLLTKNKNKIKNPNMIYVGQVLQV